MKTIPVNLVETDDATEGEVLIYDIIGSDGYGGGVSARNFVQDLAALGDVSKITVRINSPGGSVFDGNAIYNALVRHKAAKVVEIDGVAASAASYIAMAGDEIRIAENATMMIHCASGLCVGPADEMEKTAKTLRMLDGQISQVYASRTGRKQETWMRLMDAETYFTADEAVKHRLADSVTPNKGKPKTAHMPQEYMSAMYKHPEKMAALLKPVEEIADLPPIASFVVEEPVAVEPEVPAVPVEFLASIAARVAEVQA